MKNLDVLDLRRLAEQVSRVAYGVRSADLDKSTPCAGMTIRDLVTHLLVSTHFSAAAGARAEPADPPEVPVTADETWKAVFAQRAEVLAHAWSEPAAWTGRTAAGGIETSAQEGGRAAAMELTLHGWDLAVATGQPFAPDPAAVNAVLELMQEWQNAEDRDQAFGAVVAVAVDAPPLHQALALSGRRPEWQP